MSKQGFRSLLVWQKARDLAVEIYEWTRQDPIAKDFGFADQLRRAAVSVPSNLAEGDERSSDREAIRFFYIAKGSLAELMTQLEIANRIGYLSTEQWTLLDDKCGQIGRMLGALIKARSRSLS